jgi:transposase-like protein
VRPSREGAEPIAEIVESEQSPLDSIVRDGARRMLQAALESEVDTFLEEHTALLDERGRRRVVRNGYLPSREIATGAGILEVSQPRVRDKPSTGDERIVFSSKILPPYLRKSRSVGELIPWLYLKGVSTGDFGQALESLIGPSAKGLSPNAVVRLKERWAGEYASGAAATSPASSTSTSGQTGST